MERMKAFEEANAAAEAEKLAREGIYYKAPAIPVHSMGVNVVRADPRYVCTDLSDDL
jgi:transposase